MHKHQPDLRLPVRLPPGCAKLIGEVSDPVGSGFIARQLQSREFPSEAQQLGSVRLKTRECCEPRLHG
jgi:hypothetical protein